MTAESKEIKQKYEAELSEAQKTIANLKAQINSKDSTINKNSKLVQELDEQIKRHQDELRTEKIRVEERDRNNLELAKQKEDLTSLNN